MTYKQGPFELAIVGEDVVVRIPKTSADTIFQFISAGARLAHSDGLISESVKMECEEDIQKVRNWLKHSGTYGTD